MEIKSLGLSDQLKMIKGFEGISSPKTQQGINAPASEKPGKSFGEFLMQQIEQVNDLGLEADKGIQRAIEGKESNPHQTIISLQKADVTFKLLMTVKDRVIEAYRQLIQTPIG